MSRIDLMRALASTTFGKNKVVLTETYKKGGIIGCDPLGQL